MSWNRKKNYGTLWKKRESHCSRIESDLRIGSNELLQTTPLPSITDAYIKLGIMCFQKTLIYTKLWHI
jgi:hypothetical protein